MMENSLAWRIWNIANARDRQITQVGLGPISTLAILALCELYDAAVEDFEKVLKLDTLLYKGPQGLGSEEQEGLDRVTKRAAKNVVKITPKATRSVTRKRKR